MTVLPWAMTAPHSHSDVYEEIRALARWSVKEVEQHGQAVLENLGDPGFDLDVNERSDGVFFDTTSVPLLHAFACSFQQSFLSPPCSKTQPFYLAVAQALLDRGADPLATDSDLYTADHYAPAFLKPPILKARAVDPKPLEDLKALEAWNTWLFKNTFSMDVLKQRFKNHRPFGLPAAFCTLVTSRLHRDHTLWMEKLLDRSIHEAPHLKQTFQVITLGLIQSHQGVLPIQAAKPFKKLRETLEEALGGADVEEKLIQCLDGRLGDFTAQVCLSLNQSSLRRHPIFLLHALATLARFPEQTTSQWRSSAERFWMHEQFTAPALSLSEVFSSQIPSQALIERVADIVPDRGSELWVQLALTSNDSYWSEVCLAWAEMHPEQRSRLLLLTKNATLGNPSRKAALNERLMDLCLPASSQQLQRQRL